MKNDITYYTIGPCEMFPETLEIEGRQTPYFRTPEFSEIFLDTTSLIKELTFAKEDDKVVILTASGTGAMEASIINTFDENDKLLIVNGGSFGSRFTELSELHNIPFDEIKIVFNEALTEESLTPFENGHYSALLVNIHETGTGQLYDVKMLSEFCKRNNMYFVVDGISSLFSDQLNFSENDIDILIFSSQKALALNPGISVVVLSGKIYSERIKSGNCALLYFDFNEYLNNGIRGQTPFTPAVDVIISMREALHRIKETGIHNKIKTTNDIANYFRSGITGLPINIPDFPMSNTLTTIIFPEHNAKEIYEKLKKEYDIILTPSGGILGDEILRVGHIGNMTKDKIDKLLTALHIIFRQHL
jgi:aspartate aminotransferase-like enzyme